MGAEQMDFSGRQPATSRRRLGLYAACWFALSFFLLAAAG